MRISDWSSDVCSSDLRPLLDTVAADLAPLAELRGTALEIAPAMPDLDVLGDALALERLIGRLLAALVAAGARDERIGIEARQDDGRIVIVIDRPDRKSTRLNSSH